MGWFGEEKRIFSQRGSLAELLTTGKCYSKTGRGRSAIKSFLKSIPPEVLVAILLWLIGFIINKKRLLLLESG